MQDVSLFFHESVNKTSNKTAYVASLRVNHSDVAGRFIVGLIELPITDSCRVSNANFSVKNYSTNTSKFSEDGVTVSMNADALTANMSVKCSRMIIMQGT